MHMIPYSLDVVIHIGVYILFALLVIDAPLNDMKEVGNDTASSETLPHIIKIKAPGIRQAFGKHLEFPGMRVETPNATVNKLTILVLGSRPTDPRLSEHTMTSI